MGKIIEWLKHPANTGSWLIAGYVLCIGGYFLFLGYESAGKIVGFLGALAIAVTLLRFSLTKIAYLVIVAPLVIGYGWWYGQCIGPEKLEVETRPDYEGMIYHTTRTMPKYRNSLPATANVFVFAPAFMADSVVRFTAWRSVEAAPKKYNLPQAK